MTNLWEMTYQTEPKDNFENTSGFNSQSDDPGHETDNEHAAASCMY